jgi:hypothetical protein
MTRRAFPAALAAVVASPGFVSGESPKVVTLQAIAGVRLPETLAISTNSPEKIREGVWELRTYQGAAPALASHFAGIFPRAGIRPLLQAANGPDLAYLIPFENLTARDRAWTDLNADPAWIRARTQFQSYHFGLYRVP